MNTESINALSTVLMSADDRLLETITTIISPHASTIASAFYATMLQSEDSRRFLSHNIVEQRLKAAMTAWTIALFEKKDAQTIDAYIARQRFIGDRHARINIPFHVLQTGIAELKREIFLSLAEAHLERQTLTEAILLAGELIDASTSIMNQAYFSDMVNDAREQQALKLHSMGVDLALQTEGLRASLYDWHRSVLGLLLKTKTPQDRIPSIRKTHFGLWVDHKGELLFPDTAEINTLRQITHQIAVQFDAAIALRQQKGNEDQIFEHLNEIDEQVTRATEILSTITERTMTLESGKDALTKLFNRRYLRAVLQKEVNLSATTGERFGLLLVDIDYFKRINDTHGHDAGDEVLKAAAETLINTVRAGDFVFRYGGEEFLVLLTALTEEQLRVVSDKILNKFRQGSVALKNGTRIEFTVSIGGALHDGHPDFENLITQADNALYTAKHAGRNQLVVA